MESFTLLPSITKMNTRKILIVEDELIIATDLSEMLFHQGFDCRICLTKEEAMLLLEQAFMPDLILCDIHLRAAQDGIELAKWIRSRSIETEIIFITAFSGTEIINKTSEIDPLNFIVKPWNEQQIKATIQIAFNYIDKKRDINNRLSVLSITEYRIIELIAQNKSSKEIADILFISEKTVRNHRYNISKKLDLPNEKNSLLKWAMQHL
jgi:DNA-binding NarL/FixJ family response regulator